jgi:tRNA A-37 threonylcarbamoyl transferase component Bud32
VGSAGHLSGRHLHQRESDVIDTPATRIGGVDPTLTKQAPSDVLRMVVAAALLVAVVLLGLLFGGSITHAVADLLRGFDELPGWLVTAQIAIAELAALLLLGLLAANAVQGRSARLLVAAVVSVVVASALTAALSSLLDIAPRPAVTQTDVALGLGGSGEVWSAPVVAALAALAAAVGPWVSRRWRWLSWFLVLVVGVTHFVVTPVSFDTIVALLCGWFVGTAVTVVNGSPSHRPRAAAIVDGLAVVGVPLASLEQASLDARGSTPYFATAQDGSKLFVKALGADERSADVLFRLYRRISRRDLADEKPFSTLRRAVEHEALVALAARDLGIRTPRMVAFATVAEPDGFVLAYEAIAGRSLDRLSPDEATDDVLDQVWELLVELRAHRIAHRDLRLANVFLDDEGQAWMIDFGFAELAASDTLLATDLAEFIASSATLVGAERAVAAAHRNVGPDVAATALPRLELPLLSGATRSAMKAQHGLLEAARSRLPTSS